MDEFSKGKKKVDTPVDSIEKTLISSFGIIYLHSFYNNFTKRKSSNFVNSNES
ncbi:hypothetical protein M2305_002780 [Gluconobacter cerinus]|nr:hypothetical protein [Gluconobacter cerinus]